MPNSVDWVFRGKRSIYNNILIVCVGNICRSPTAEVILQQKLPNKTISSAGLQALVGHDIEKKAASILEAKGYSFGKHVARKLDLELIQEADLVLVMEKDHQSLIMQKYPEASGKIMLFGKWQDNADIHDPFRKSPEVFSYVFDQIEKNCLNWSKKLAS